MTTSFDQLQNADIFKTESRTTSFQNSTAFHSVTDNLTGTDSGGLDAVFTLRACILVVGFLAVIANSFVLIALMSKSVRKYNTNVLILNQTVIDLYTGVMLVITNAIKMPNPVYSGIGGDMLCCLFGSEMLMWIGLDTSTFGLVFITLERYLKIVHPIWHRKHFTNWMLYVAMLISWVEGICMELSAGITSRVVNGMCIPLAFWLSPSFQLAFAYVTFIWQFVFVIALLAFCYGSIFYVVRRQVKVNTLEHSDHDGSDKKSKSNPTERNILATMIIVTFTFFFCWISAAIYQIVADVTSSIELNVTIFYATALIGLLDVVLNPLIYASKHQHINRRLREMIGCGIKPKIVSGSIYYSAQENRRTSKLDVTGSAERTNKNVASASNVAETLAGP